jgi:hypothetical protein
VHLLKFGCEVLQDLQEICPYIRYYIKGKLVNCVGSNTYGCTLKHKALKFNNTDNRILQHFLSQETQMFCYLSFHLPGYSKFNCKQIYVEDSYFACMYVRRQGKCLIITALDALLVQLDLVRTTIIASKRYTRTKATAK